MQLCSWRCDKKTLIDFRNFAPKVIDRRIRSLSFLYWDRLNTSCKSQSHRLESKFSIPLELVLSLNKEEFGSLEAFYLFIYLFIIIFAFFQRRRPCKHCYNNILLLAFFSYIRRILTVIIQQSYANYHLVLLKLTRTCLNDFQVNHQNS